MTITPVAFIWESPLPPLQGFLVLHCTCVADSYQYDLLVETYEFTVQCSNRSVTFNSFFIWQDFRTAPYLKNCYVHIFCDSNSIHVRRFLKRVTCSMTVMHVHVNVQFMCGAVRKPFRLFSLLIVNRSFT